MRSHGDWSAYLLFAATAFAGVAPLGASQVPLSSEIPFPPAASKAPVAVTVVIPPELKELVIARRMRLQTFSFAIGKALSANLERALASRYESVAMVDARPEAAHGLAVEVSTIAVQPDLPATSFGGFTSTLTVGFLVHADGPPREVTITRQGSNKKSAGRVVFQSPVSAMRSAAVQLGRATDVALAETLDELLRQVPLP